MEQNSTFNFAPLQDFVINSTRPAELANIIDEIIFSYVDYLLTATGSVPNRYEAEQISTMKQMRDCILAGYSESNCDACTSSGIKFMSVNR